MNSDAHSDPSLCSGFQTDHLLLFSAMTECLFCKIIAGKIPSKKVYEDEKAFAFEDINPQAPTHVLIISKKHIAGIDQATEADAELVGYCQLVAAKIAGAKLGHRFRTDFDVSPGRWPDSFPSASAFAGGRKMHWPPDSTQDIDTPNSEISAVAESKE